MSKNKKVKKSAAILATIGIITTGGIWIVSDEVQPYEAAIVNEELVDAEEIYKDKCLTFNSLEDAEAEQLRVDIVKGYAVENVDDEGNAIITYPFSTKHTYSIQKHPTKDKWKICYPIEKGMNNKKMNVELFDEDKIDKFKKKDDAEILEFTVTDI